MPKPRVKRFADGPEVREWAMGLSDEERKTLGIEGIEVSARGRFHSKLVQAFNRAHKQAGVMYVPIGRSQPRLNEVFEEAMDKVESDQPEVYRQSRQEEPAPKPEAKKSEPKEEAPAPQPTTVRHDPAPSLAGAPAAVMEMLRSGQNVVVVYVPVQIPATAEELASAS